MSRQSAMPADVSAEQRLLGLFTQGDEDALLAAREALEPADFYDPFHSLVFEAVLALVKRGQRPDTVLIRSELHLAGKLPSDGDERMLRLSDVLHVGDPDALVARIRSLAVVRAVIDSALRIAAEGRGGLEDADDFVDRAQQSILYACERRGDSVEVTTLATAVRGAVEELQRRASSPDRLLGVSTGLSALDKQTGGFVPGDLIVLAGRPGMGKSALAQLHARTAAETGGGKAVVVFSLEMPPSTWAQRLMAAGAPLDVKSVRTGQGIARHDWDRLIGEAERLQGLPVYIPNTTGITPMGMRRIARKLYAKHGGLALMVVDYLQISRADGKHGNREQEVAEISRALKETAMELHVPVVALSQLNRTCEARGDKRPMLGDLRESGAIEQDADIVIGLYRDEVYNGDSKHKGVCELLLLKQRNGPVGSVPAAFAQSYTRFGDLDLEAEARFYDKDEGGYR